MSVTFGTLPKVVRRVTGGTLRVGDSRVSLDSVIYAYNRGENAAEIQESFPTLTLAEVHAAIAFYLHNKSEVDQYLADRVAEFERSRAKYSTPGLREKLLARRGKPREEWDQ